MIKAARSLTLVSVSLLGLLGLSGCGGDAAQEFQCASTDTAPAIVAPSFRATQRFELLTTCYKSLAKDLRDSLQFRVKLGEETVVPDGSGGVKQGFRGANCTLALTQDGGEIAGQDTGCGNSAYEGCIAEDGQMRLEASGSWPIPNVPALAGCVVDWSETIRASGVGPDNGATYEYGFEFRNCPHLTNDRSCRFEYSANWEPLTPP